MKETILIILFNSLFFWASSQPCNPSNPVICDPIHGPKLNHVLTPDPCENLFVLSDLPEGFITSYWTFNYEDECESQFLVLPKEFPDDDFINHIEYSCFQRNINSLVVVITWQDENQNEWCCKQVLSNISIGGSNLPDCDPSASILDGLSFFITYVEPGMAPCIPGSNVTGYHLSSFNFPELCFEHCPELNDFEIIVCWTDGCINYQETFQIDDPCDDLKDVRIRPILVGSEFSVTVKQEGNCCTSDYIGSRSLIVEGFEDPCEETLPCDAICTGPLQRKGPYNLIEDSETCAQLPPECDELSVQVAYVGATCDGLYNFEATISNSPNCNIIEQEGHGWQCWKYNQVTGMRDPITCIPGGSPTEVSIDVTQHAVGEAVGACLVVKDDCGCEARTCDPGQTIFDICDYEVEFAGQLEGGGYFFSFNSIYFPECDEINWTAQCGNFDLPITPVDGGAVVFPGFECFILTVCAQIEGCENQCVEVNIGFPQPVMNDEPQRTKSAKKDEDISAEKASSAIQNGDVQVYVDPATLNDGDGYVGFYTELELEPGCEDLEWFFWSAWQYSPITGNFINFSTIFESEDYAIFDMSEACPNFRITTQFMIKDGCDNYHVDQEDIYLQGDLCEYEIEFAGVTFEGGYFFSFDPYSTGCVDVVWSVSCGNIDIPYTEVDGGIIVYPGLECFSLSVCAQVTGCQPKCLFVPVGFDPIKDPALKFRSSEGSDSSPLQDASIHPNPAEQRVHVALDNPESNIKELNIYSISGQLINSLQHLGSRVNIDISNYTEGTYMIKILDDQGNRYIKKLIVR